MTILDKILPQSWAKAIRRLVPTKAKGPQEGKVAQASLQVSAPRPTTVSEAVIPQGWDVIRNGQRKSIALHMGEHIQIAFPGCETNEASLSLVNNDGIIWLSYRVGSEQNSFPIQMLDIVPIGRDRHTSWIPIPEEVRLISHEHFSIQFLGRSNDLSLDAFDKINIEISQRASGILFKTSRTTYRSSPGFKVYVDRPQLPHKMPGITICFEEGEHLSLEVRSIPCIIYRQDGRLWLKSRRCKPLALAEATTYFSVGPSGLEKSEVLQDLAITIAASDSDKTIVLLISPFYSKNTKTVICDGTAQIMDSQASAGNQGPRRGMAPIQGTVPMTALRDRDED